MSVEHKDGKFCLICDKCGTAQDEAPGEWKSDKTVEDYLDYCPKCYEN